MAAAWDEVYWLMAFALVNQERGLYSARGVRPQTVWRPWRVIEKSLETNEVTTLVVERIDDRLVKSSLPGQYVTVIMLMPDGVRQPRQYSLTRADDGRHRQFSVKRVRGKPDGEVSTLLCDAVEVGDVVTMSLPFGSPSRSVTRSSKTSGHCRTHVRTSGTSGERIPTYLWMASAPAS